jgi:NAD(P)-dependent dehydrogenase (short-subunit alcohol dehydrogenase family)
MTNLISGRVALVTGGGRGLGRAHALALAAEGAQVVIADLSGSEDIPRLTSLAGFDLAWMRGGLSAWARSHLLSR